MVYKQLAFLVNIAFESEGQKQLLEMDIIPYCETLLKNINSKDCKDTINRLLNMLSKILKIPDAALQASNFRHLVFKVVLYTSKQFSGEVQ